MLSFLHNNNFMFNSFNWVQILGQGMGYKSVAHLLMDELKLADKMPSL